MRSRSHVGVIDIGKTNVKVAVVDLVAMQEMAVLTAPNIVLQREPYPHFDTDRLWDFILDSLAALHRAHGIDTLTVTTHGAAAALLDRSGALALPVLDYEHDGPDQLAGPYDALRPDFAETGSPRLPMGLNLGAQLFWQLETFSGLGRRLAHVITYPQYWVWRLTGKLATEATSLGCHTDLWTPAPRSFSSLVDRLDLRGRMAPVRKATDRIGTIVPTIASRTGLNPATMVHCGIHDSNASLYPHLLQRHSPFAVVSTGTWVICMAIGGRPVRLDPARDTLINVSALGDAVPSARFMGGREFEVICKGHALTSSDCDVAAVLDRRVMLLPSVETRSGPFQGRSASWTTDAARLTDGQRFAAVSFYLALMTATCLEMIGAEGGVIVEGPFFRNKLYLDMLGAALNRAIDGVGDCATGTSVGAALLTRRINARPHAAEPQILRSDPRLVQYSKNWIRFAGRV